MKHIKPLYGEKTFMATCGITPQSMTRKYPRQEITKTNVTACEPWIAAQEPQQLLKYSYSIALVKLDR